MIPEHVSATPFIAIRSRHIRFSTITFDPIIAIHAEQLERLRLRAFLRCATRPLPFARLPFSIHIHMPAHPTQSPVRAARERLGLTRERLAVKANLSVTSLYLAERLRHVTPATAAKLAPILGVRARDLMT